MSDGAAACEARGRVDEVAGHHALALDAERDGRLAGADGGPRAQAPARDRPAQLADRRHQLERGADGALRIVLVGDRGAPHRHDGVADELLEVPP